MESKVYHFSIGVWNCFDSVVFCFLLYYHHCSVTSDLFLIFWMQK